MSTARFMRKKRYLEPEAVPTLYAASAQHRDATPALEPTCKRPCFVESRDTGTSCGSPYELPAVDETSQFSSPDSQVPHDGDDVIAEHVAASPEHTEKCNDLTQCRVPKASKATQTSAMTVMQDVGVQAVKTSAEIGHGVLYPKYQHKKLEARKWLEPDTEAYDKVCSIVSNKHLLEDIRQMSPNFQTYAVESFHAIINRFASKSYAFSCHGIQARYQLAALHYN
ncbi:hypothetical protein MRX96_058444 [Rhipicephalus microplus]